MCIAVYAAEGKVTRYDWSAHTPRAKAEGALINPRGADLLRSEPLWCLRVDRGAVVVDPAAVAPVVVPPRPELTVELEAALRDVLRRRPTETALAAALNTVSPLDLRVR